MGKSHCAWKRYILFATDFWVKIVIRNGFSQSNNHHSINFVVKQRAFSQFLWNSIAQFNSLSNEALPNPTRSQNVENTKNSTPCPASHGGAQGGLGTAAPPMLTAEPEWPGAARRGCTRTGSRKSRPRTAPGPPRSGRRTHYLLRLLDRRSGRPGDRAARRICGPWSSWERPGPWGRRSGRRNRRTGHQSCWLRRSRALRYHPGCSCLGSHRLGEEVKMNSVY